MSVKLLYRDEQGRDADADLPMERAVYLGRGPECIVRTDDQEVAINGLGCWTDAALFNAAGIPALCFGPGDIARAHSAEEWVERSQIERATQVLERVCSAWGKP